MKGLPTDFALYHARTYGLSTETDHDIIQEMWDQAVDLADFNARVLRWSNARSLVPPVDALDMNWYEFKPEGMTPVSGGGELPRTMQIPIHLGGVTPESINFGKSGHLVPICRYCKQGEDDHAPDCPGDTVAMLLRIQTLERELRQVKATLEAGK